MVNEHMNNISKWIIRINYIIFTCDLIIKELKKYAKKDLYTIQSYMYINYTSNESWLKLWHLNLHTS